MSLAGDMQRLPALQRGSESPDRPEAARGPVSAQAATRCSQLSSTTGRVRTCTWLSTASIKGRAGVVSLTPAPSDRLQHEALDPKRSKLDKPDAVGIAIEHASWPLAGPAASCRFRLCRRGSEAAVCCSSSSTSSRASVATHEGIQLLRKVVRHRFRRATATRKGVPQSWVLELIQPFRSRKVSKTDRTQDPAVPRRSGEAIAGEQGDCLARPAPDHRGRCTHDASRAIHVAAEEIRCRDARQRRHADRSEPEVRASGTDSVSARPI